MKSRKVNGMLLLLTYSLLIAPTLSRYIQSTGSGGIGTALTRDKKTGELVVVGTKYSDRFWGLDSIKQTGPTSCFIAHGDLTDADFIRKSFRVPEMCFGDAFALDLGNIESTAIVTGISRGNSDVVTFYGYHAAEQQHALSREYFPVAMSHDEDDKIIMGFHEYDGEPFLEEKIKMSAENLEGLLDYWDRLTSPEKMSSTKTRLTKISANTGRIHFDKHINTNDGFSTIASMVRLKHQNRFVIAGSTNGSGEPFGAYPISKNDWDGYIAIFDSTTGELVFDGGNHRIASEDGKDDFVHSVCSHKHDIYIAGITKGSMTGTDQGGVFLVKMDTLDRKIVWKRQFGDAARFSYDHVTCEAHHRGVFVGGSHLSNSLEEGITSDIFARRFDTNGTQIWSRILDSSLVTGMNADDIMAGLNLNYEGTELNALLNVRTIDKDENEIMLIDIDVGTGDSDLSLAAEAVEDDTFDAPLFWTILSFCLIIVSWTILCWRRWFMQQKITRDHMSADADYENNLKKWMDDDEIFDYDQDGLFKSHLPDRKLTLKPCIRGNHLRFGTLTTSDKRYFDVDFD
eukprot:scaffold2557_cov121-Cylindrotheca_fusiformis.AAC.30